MDTMADESAVSANLAVDATVEGGDVGENPSLGDIGESSEGPASLNLAVGPPSPLTGCYLLIVIGEPYSQEHKDVILQKLLKGKSLKKFSFQWSRKPTNVKITVGTILSSSVKNNFSLCVKKIRFPFRNVASSQSK